MGKKYKEVDFAVKIVEKYAQTDAITANDASKFIFIKPPPERETLFA